MNVWNSQLFHSRGQFLLSTNIHKVWNSSAMKALLLFDQQVYQLLTTVGNLNFENAYDKFCDCTIL